MSDSVTTPTEPRTEAMMDGPTTRKPHDTPFSEWTVLPADDADGVRWYFHVPTAAILAIEAEASQPEPAVTEALRDAAERVVEAWREAIPFSLISEEADVAAAVSALDRALAAVPAPSPAPADLEVACPECGHDVDHTTKCPEGCPLCSSAPAAEPSSGLPPDRPMPTNHRVWPPFTNRDQELAQAFREAVALAHDLSAQNPHPFLKPAHLLVEDDDYNCPNGWCQRFWAMVREAEDRAKARAWTWSGSPWRSSPLDMPPLDGTDTEYHAFMEAVSGEPAPATEPSRFEDIAPAGAAISDVVGEQQLVAALSDAMLQKLAKNRGKRHWRDAQPGYLSERLEQEFEELGEAVSAFLNGQATPEDVWLEAADVANFTAMLASNVAGLREARAASPSPAVAPLDVGRLAWAMMEALTPGYRTGPGSKAYQRLHMQRAKQIAAAYAEASEQEASDA